MDSVRYSIRRGDIRYVDRDREVIYRHVTVTEDSLLNYIQTQVGRDGKFRAHCLWRVPNAPGDWSAEDRST